MKKTNGSIGVTSDNIFPIIKKFLYSDHEIFLREIVSNAVDATQKLKTLSSKGEIKGELGDLTIRIKIDGNKLIVSDSGIGMTSEEIDRFINQIAISGAEEFLEKYKDDTAAIIGHFGLGFYSSFMVASKVQIDTLSYKEGAQPVLWTCNGDPNFQMEAGTRKQRGTDIIIHIDDDNKEFLQPEKIEELLNKYCQFLPIPISFGYEKEWKDDKYVDTDKEKIINNTEPAWTKRPTELTDEDYLNFYNELYPYSEPPLFWIHLNIDYPFQLTGILYFPKITNNIDLSRHKIQLYSNQVFVTENVEGIVPDYLTILHGVLDSPDIPLNVSRSYLQSDRNVKKISAYITRKVADKLDELFREDRSKYEEKWDAIELFIKYGMLSEEKFYERSPKFFLFKNTDGKYFTLDEYKELTKETQKDKNNNTIYLYANDKETQYTFIKAAKDKGYDVLLLDGRLDTPLISLLEQKLESVRFARVDSDAPDKLIQKEDKDSTESVTQKTQEILQGVFNGVVPETKDKNFMIRVSHGGNNAKPLTIVRNEFMRRMKDMAEFQPGVNFYGEMPDSYEILLNVDHPLIIKILDEFNNEDDTDLKKIDGEIKGFSARKDAINQSLSKETSDEEKKTLENDLNETKAKIDELTKQKNEIYRKFGKDNKLASQLIDLGLLANGLLSGKQLDQFITRSIDMIES